MKSETSLKFDFGDGHYWDVEVVPDHSEPGFDDNVFLRVTEASAARFKLLRSDQITIGITAANARALAQRLLEVAAADEAATRRRTPGVPFTPKQGRYLAFIQHYMSRFGVAPAESDIQRHFLVSAPTVNQMMQRMERLGLIARTPGKARSIRLLVPRESIPSL